MYGVPVYHEKLALFLLKMCALTYDQYHNDGKVNIPKGFKLVKRFKAKSLNEEEWFGFILESKDSVVIAFRGTQSNPDWIADARVAQSPFPYLTGGGSVHRGFLSIYASCRDEILAAYQFLSKRKRLYITGHSLGGALATLHAIDVAGNGLFRKVLMYNFGSPRVGNSLFAATYHHFVPLSLRFVNIHDLVPMLPPTVVYGPIRKEEWHYTHVHSPMKFSVQAGSIEANHSLQSYKKGIKSLPHAYERKDS